MKKVRKLVNNNDSLNIMLNEIVDNELNKTIDDMIKQVQMFSQSTYVLSCTTVIDLLNSYKR